jgi:signal transduction histidine kinase
MSRPTLRDALASTQARLELLLQASELLARSLDFEATLAHLATLLVPRIADGYVVDVVDERGEIKRVAAVDENPEKQEVVARLRHLGPPNPKARDGIQSILEASTSRVSERITPDGLRAGARDEAHYQMLLALDLHSGLIVPLRARGRAIGLLWLYFARSKRTYAKEDLPVVEEIAARAALAIENARLWREAQDAIRTRDEFLAIASHELRTPLTSLLLRVQGELRRLHREPTYAPSHDDLRVWLGATNQQVGKLARLVEEMLDVSRMTLGKFRLAPEETSLGTLVREAVSTLAEEAGRRGCALDVAIAPEAEGLVGFWDPMRLEQVVIALLSNAIKYGEGKPVRVAIDRDGDVARVSVIDEGIGIDPAHVERIFERFERQVSSRHYGGFGLGLWIARQIVETSGGHVRVESTPGKGSRFVVELPVKGRG